MLKDFLIKLMSFCHKDRPVHPRVCRRRLAARCVRHRRFRRASAHRFRAGGARERDVCPADEFGALSAEPEALLCAHDHRQVIDFFFPLDNCIFFSLGRKSIFFFIR